MASVGVHELSSCPTASVRPQSTPEDSAGTSNEQRYLELPTASVGVHEITSYPMASVHPQSTLEDSTGGSNADFVRLSSLSNSQRLPPCNQSLWVIGSGHLASADMY